MKPAKKRTLAKIPKKPGETGRPRLDIDAAEVSRLAEIGCTNREIGAWFGCDGDTIGERFPDELTKGRVDVKTRLRRRQVELAMEGDRTMLIWLGKQMLGQADSPTVAIQNNVTNVMSNKERIDAWRQTMVQELSLPEESLADGNHQPDSDA